MGPVPGSFSEIVSDSLGQPPYAGADAAVPLERLSPEARSFILRMIALMRQGGWPATEITPYCTWQLANMIPSILPGAWGGRVPPLTMPGRHARLDAYVASLPMTPAGRRPVLVDLGCGSPPVTTVESARRLPAWDVIGVDRSFARYLVVDEHGDYACFDEDQRFLYFQARPGGRGRELYQDPVGAFRYFQGLFAELAPALTGLDEEASETVCRGQRRLVRNQTRDLEAAHLRFVAADIADTDLPPADVVRCMNVLLYFAGRGRETLLARAGRLLRAEGTLLAGTNGASGTTARYCVYQRRDYHLVPTEFAFSLDNLRTLGVMPWFTLHDHDSEAVALARLTRSLRGSAGFWQGFSARVDDLSAELNLCRRAADGYLEVPDPWPPTEEIVRRSAAVWARIQEEGHVRAAAEAHQRGGHESWVNPVGDVAVRPTWLDLFPTVRVG
jgi:hypothetical protein